MDTNLLPPADATCHSTRPSPLLLVVDDREANLEAMRAILDKDDNWQLRCVKSGEAALQCLLQEDVSLVLLDVQMPGMDGYEVAELMRGNPRTRYTPIIFVSAIARTQDLILRGYSTGAVDFILKPFDPSILRHKALNLLAYENSRRELQHVNQQLERERAFNASVLTNAAEGIMVVGQDGLIQYANPMMAKMIGSTPDTLHGSAFLPLVDTPQGDWLQSPFYQHWRSGQTYREHDATLNTVRGDRLPVTLSCSPLPHSQRAMVILVRDISVERDLLQRLEALIITDPLTGLLNRRGFYQIVESALARIRRSGDRLAVLYLDLDGFKRINDSLGHDAGDELLRRVANQLKLGLRSYDSLARLGVDEFTVLLDSLDHTRDAARVAEKLMTQISARQQIKGENLSITASVGIASYPECGEDVESLLRAADMAMYEAKRNGRQQFHFHSPQLTVRAQARLELEQRLHQAIEQQHFALAWQPQFYLDSGRLRGFEVLLRWPHGNPDRATPDKFIPMLEENRLINPLGQWIFSESIARLAELHAHFGNQLVLSINVSPVQFAASQLPDLLAAQLHEHGIPPTQLEVEITESVLMPDQDSIHLQLHQLHELGVKIAVDDFGTGYSSLAYLRQFNFDTLKIDRAFITNLLDSPRDAAVANAIIELGRHLGLDIIAEGVETQEQRQWLVGHHCTVMQGWLAAPALAFEKAMQLPAQLDWNQLPLTGQRRLSFRERCLA